MKPFLVKLSTFLLVFLSLSGCNRSNVATTFSSGPAIPSDPEIERNVRNTLKGLTLEEKVGQMMQITVGVLLDSQTHGFNEEAVQTVFGKYKVGSILNTFFDRAQTAEVTADMVSELQKKSLEMTGIPMVYGMDMIHGASYLADGTLFPQEINMAATFQPEYVRLMGEAITHGTLEGQIKPSDTTMFRLQSNSDGELVSYLAHGRFLDVNPCSFGSIGVVAIPEFARFYRHVLVQKRFPHHGAFGFARCGKVLFDALKLLGAPADAINVPKPAGQLYPTENPFVR